jgi:hypothetical protein
MLPHKRGGVRSHQLPAGQSRAGTWHPQASVLQLVALASFPEACSEIPPPEYPLTTTKSLEYCKGATIHDIRLNKEQGFW